MFGDAEHLAKEIVMSINLTDRVALSQYRSGIADFRLGLNSAGWWVLRNATQQKAGVFRTREAAIKYARGESPNGIFTIVYEPDGLELNDRVPQRAA
jgi:hypothetical protein